MKLIRTKYLLYISAAAFIFLLAGPSEAAFAASLKVSKTPPKTEAAESIKDATVNLYCRLKGRKNILSTSGSGVFISERGVILTNAHVAQYFLLAREKGRVTGRCTVRTGSPAKAAYTAEVLYFPLSWLVQNGTKISEKVPKGTGEDDFALLYVTGAKRGKLPERFPVMPLDHSGNIAEETPVTIAGYPIEKLNFKQISGKLPFAMDTSIISNIGSFGSNQADVITIAPSKVAQNGISGGPVLNDTGQLLGIISIKSSGKTPKLRAITLSYIDRAIYAQTGMPLAALLAGDFESQSLANKSLISPETIFKLGAGLRGKIK